MCRRWRDPEPCMNDRCPNNLFWKDLKLDGEKIRMTDKALEIRNCCCLITTPWTSEEISNTWGLTREQINRSEEEAFKKLRREVHKRSAILQLVEKEKINTLFGEGGYG